MDKKSGGNKQLITILCQNRNCLKTQLFITAEIAEGTEFKTREFQSTLGFSDASAFFAHSAVKLEDFVYNEKRIKTWF